MAEQPNVQMLNTYRKAVSDLQTKLGRQQNAVEATSGQIAGFEAMIKQLEGKK